MPAAPRRVADDPAPETTAVHIAIIDDDSGQLLYSEQPYTEVPQASTTKIATTIVALERSPDLRKRIKVTVSAIGDGRARRVVDDGHRAWPQRVARHVAARHDVAQRQRRRRTGGGGAGRLARAVRRAG